MLRDLGKIGPAIVIGWTLGTAPLGADTLLLKNGGRVDGLIQRRPAAEASGKEGSYLVQVREGILVRIAAQDVGRVVEPSAEEREYARLLPQMPDTAAGHQTMAQWCQEHGLSEQKDFHWQQALRHDPDHEAARRALGYARIRGRWARPEELMQAQGYIRYKGAWRLPQQVAVEQQQEEIEIAEKNWRRDIELWRSWLSGRRRDEGWERLQGIEDPLAATGLAQLLTSEADARVRELYVDLLARLANSTALAALTEAAIYDEDGEVRIRCIDYLRELAADQALRAWTAVLGSPDNALVNRAGVALGRLGHPDAIPALIDALVTQHETLIKPSANIQPSFGSAADGSGGFNGLSVGGGPKKVKRNLENRSVLEALVALTQQNHRYSQSDWKNWYIRQRQIPDGVNLRRD